LLTGESRTKFLLNYLMIEAETRTQAQASVLGPELGGKTARSNIATPALYELNEKQYLVIACGYGFHLQQNGIINLLI
jgi:hypothetical protein